MANTSDIHCVTGQNKTVDKLGSRPPSRRAATPVYDPSMQTGEVQGFAESLQYPQKSGLCSLYGICGQPQTVDGSTLWFVLLPMPNQTWYFTTCVDIQERSYNLKGNPQGKSPSSLDSRPLREGLVSTVCACATYYPESG